ncbi:MAG TPA: bacteriohopanetetrol glucosamine biosynthesis glycosyltransferase HpnI [Roseiarcus sp.]|jgi:ceramide glucosyltransferase
MNYGLEQIGALTMGWLSLLFIAASVFGSVCALGAAWAARWFVRQPASLPPTRWPDVSILKPLYGAEAQLSENIETYFHQDYAGKIQFVFGVQDPDDRAIPVVKSLMQRYPQLDLHLVVNGAAHGANRKVSNLINMGQIARHPLIVIADSDVAVGPNYLRTLASGLAQPGVGVVTCLYRGLPGGGFWSRLSSMAVDDHFLPATILGLALGLARPCLGATIAVSRETLIRIGGFQTVANQLADDYAIGKAARQAALRVVVPPMLVAHTFEENSLSDVLRHELRWARTIFTVDSLGYIGSSLTHAFPLAVIGAALRGFDGWGLAAVLGALTCRLFLKYRLTREFELPNPSYGLLLARDMLSFAIYFGSFLSPRVSWRGQDFTVARDGTLLATAESRVGSASFGKAMR